MLSYFDVVLQLSRSYNPASYAGGSLILVGSPNPDRLKVITQIKRFALAFQVGGGKRWRQSHLRE
jgi:hypothetical protein